MKKCFAVLLAIAVLCLAGCNQKGTTWQEQYDLGVRYLEEGSYEEAIIAFTAAIEIDPKQPEVYLKAAEAYLALDDTDSAISILEQGYEATADQQLLDKERELAKGSVQWNLLTTAQQELLISLDEATERFDGATVQQLMSSKEFSGLFSFAVSGGDDGNAGYFKVEGENKQYDLGFWSRDGKFYYWFDIVDEDSYQEAVYWQSSNDVGISHMGGEQSCENGPFEKITFWSDGRTTTSKGTALDGIRVGVETVIHSNGMREVYECDQQGNLVRYENNVYGRRDISDEDYSYPMQASVYHGYHYISGEADG